MLQFWHFILPITKLTVLVFSLIAGISYFHMRRSVRLFAPISSIDWRKAVLYAVLFTFTIFWLVTRTMFSASVYDHALYYLQTEKWFTTFPIVPGLGNLHGRLAFNSSYLLFTSLFQSWFGLPRAFHVGNGLLILVLLAQLVQGTIGVVRAGSRAPFWQWFCLLSLAPLLHQLVLNWRIGWTNDFPVYVLGIVMSIQVLKLLECKEKSSAEIFYRICVLTLLAAIGITIKLSFAAWCFGLLGFVLITYRQVVFAHSMAFRRMGLLTTLLMMVLLPWVVRNVVLSGYLIYPVAITAFPVSWRIPIPAVVAEAQAISGWARMPNENWAQALNNWDWLSGWWQRLIARTFDVVLPIGITVVALMRLMVFQWKFQPPAKLLWLIPLTASLSLVYWFLTAPDVRFAGSLFWLLANGLLIIALTTLPAKYRSILLYAVVLMTVVFTLTDIGAFTERGATNAPQFMPTLQSVPLEDYTVFFPVSGDSCGDAPIPCAPHAPGPGLRLLTPDNLAGGFRITDGP